MLSVMEQLNQKPHRRRFILKTLIISIILVALCTEYMYVFFPYIHIHKNSPSSLPSKRILANKTQRKNRTFPIRLKIPAINVDAAVEYVGVTPNGAMGVPSTIADVGWFNLGPLPGERGSAVIDGHFDGQNGEPAVFSHLDLLKKGDKIDILQDNGNVITFIVQGTQAYEPGYAENVFSQGDGLHLNLITCDGVWDISKKSYSKRLVIFSDMMQ